MSKVIDITDKLNFAEKPKIKLKGEEFKVNNSATAILKILPKLDEKSSINSINEIFEMLFDEESRKKIEAFKLDFKDFTTLVMESVKLASGSDDKQPEGEAQTPATT